MFGWHIVIIGLLSVALLSTAQSERQTSHAMTLPEAIDTMRPSIVQISYEAMDLPAEVRRQTGRGWAIGSLGTGFFVNSEGYVVTALHVIRGGQTILQQIQAGRKQMLVGLAIPNTEDERGNKMIGNFVLVQFDIVDKDERHDLVLLKLRRNPFKGEVKSGFVIAGKEIPLPVRVASLTSKRPREGAPVAISGYPLGQPILVTNGGSVAASWSFDIAQVQPPGAPDWFRVPDIADSYLVDVEVNRGNSGGPTYLTDSGAVIGVCVRSEPAPVRNQNGQNVVINSHQCIQLWADCRCSHSLRD